MKTALEKINEAFRNWLEPDGETVIYNRSYLLEKIYQIAKENSQPFSPELITELFDGWEYQKEHEILINGRVVIELLYESEPRYNSVIINDEGFVMTAPMLRTLDEFITLCQQTEIELKERG